jgi:hypothetical protein
MTSRPQPTAEDRKDAAERLDEIREEMVGLLDEAKRIVRANLTDADLERARRYWGAQIDLALGDNSEGWLGECPHTMADTVEVQRGGGEPDDDADDEENSR